ncbi:MAG: T9SS type A sorting domain-containing protein [bacterium]
MKKLLLAMIAILFITNLFTAQCQINWEQLNGPFGGSIQEISKNSNDDIFVIVNNNIYESSDLGLNWVKIPNKVFATSNIFQFDDIVFGLSTENTSSKNSIYVSTDNMKTWTKKSSGIENQFVNRIKQINNAFYACSDSGVFVSKNKGESWELAYKVKSTKNKWIFDIVVNSKGTIFLATMYGLFRSTDDGVTWVQMNKENAKMKSNIENTLLTDDDKIFVNTIDGMFKSFDDGDTWVQIGAGIIKSNLAFILNPKQGEIVVGKSWGGMYTSTDYGNTWQQINEIDVYNIIKTSDGKFLAATRKGVLFSNSLTDNWSTRNEGINELYLTCVYINKSTGIHKDEIIVGSLDGMIYKSTDLGKTYKQVHQMNNSRITAIIAGPNDYLYASSGWSGIARSKDFGETWENVNTGVDDTDITSLTVDKNGNIYAGAFSVIYKSINNGDSWTTCLSGNESVQCTSLQVNSKGTIFAGTMSYGVMKSTNGGAVWQQMATGLAVPISYISMNKKDEVFATTFEGHLYSSSNDGVKWDIVAQSEGITTMFFIDDNDVLSCVDQDHLVVGVHRSKDKGKHWSREDNGLQEQYVNSFDSNSQGVIFAASTSGLFKSSQPIVSVNDNIVNSANINIYPNPSSAKINIELPDIDLASCSLIITNSLGVELKRLSGSELLNKSLILDTENFTSGLYHCSIINNNQVSSKPFIIIR